MAPDDLNLTVDFNDASFEDESSMTLISRKRGLQIETQLATMHQWQKKALAQRQQNLF